MSDDANSSGPKPAKSDLSRRRRARLRAYFETWLVSTFLVCSFAIVWHLGEKAAGRAGMGNAGAVFFVAPVLSLLSLPALWLLRIFRERSPSTWLRFIRRLLLGVICGTFPAALLALLSARKEGSASDGANTLWVSGIAFGFIAGLVDAMHIDSERDSERDAERNAERGAERDVDALSD